MILLATSQALAPGRTAQISASGATGTVTFSVVPGGAGGTINSSTGVFTAVNYGVDTVLAVDSGGPTATLQVLTCSPLELVCDILQSQLALAPGRVFLWDQKIFEPQDSSLYVVVGVLSCKPFGNNVSYQAGSGLSAVQSINMQATLSLDVISRGTDAIYRKEEVLMALASDYAQTQCNLNSFYIAPISTGFQNLSEQDGAAILYRFNVSVNMQYSISKTQSANYYSSFSDTIITNP